MAYYRIGKCGCCGVCCCGCRKIKLEITQLIFCIDYIFLGVPGVNEVHTVNGPFTGGEILIDKGDPPPFGDCVWSAANSDPVPASSVDLTSYTYSYLGTDYFPNTLILGANNIGFTTWNTTVGCQTADSPYWSFATDHSGAAGDFSTLSVESVSCYPFEVNLTATTLPAGGPGSAGFYFWNTPSGGTSGNQSIRIKWKITCDDAEEMMMMRAAAAGQPTCVDYGVKLPSGDVALLGGNPVCDHYACKTGEHKYHRACVPKL